jgi:hypothetical protein
MSESSEIAGGNHAASKRLPKSLAWAAVGIVVVLLIIFFLLFPTALRPETLGEILVESPEVYTRERLVNDRYQQDFWLEKQLERLDASTELLRGQIRTDRAGGVAFGVGAPIREPAQPTAPAIDAVNSLGPGRPLPFDLEFRVRSGIRDMIRQSILENQLDDRHDLLGNSIFVLKFDTTVIPGDATTRSAIIRVTLDIPGSQRLLEVGNDGVPRFIHAYFDDLDSEGVLRAELANWEERYKEWTRGLQTRLNRYSENYRNAFARSGLLPIEDYGDFLRYARQVQAVTGAQDTAKLSGQDRSDFIDAVYDLCREQRKMKVAGSKAAPSSVPIEEPLTVMPAAQHTAGPEDTDANSAATLDPSDDMDGEKCYSRLVESFSIRKALRGLLASPDEAISETEWQGESSATINITPRDQARFIFIQYTNNQPIEVNPRQDPVYLLSSGCMKSPDFETKKQRPILLNEIDVRTDASGHIVNGARSGWLESLRSRLAGRRTQRFNLVTFVEAGTVELVPERTLPAYTVTPEVLAAIAGAGRLNTATFAPAAAAKGSPEPAPACNAYTTLLPSGFFNFLSEIAETDAFSYAVLPKQETQAYNRDVSMAITALTAGGYAAMDVGGEAWARTLEQIQETTSRSTVIGFGSSRTAAQSGGELQTAQTGEDTVFGWVITPNSMDPGPGAGRVFSEPTQRSMSAMISVPAWHDAIRFVVETGWLDSTGAPEITKSYTLSVPVPTDFDAIDGVLREDWEERRPSILDTEMEIYDLVACQPASILIPGYRLWRSTSVTLGAQRADRIVVLPNMEGIVAVFDEVYSPTVPQENGEVYVPLRVWTSEGTDVAPEAVRIAPVAGSGICALQAARIKRLEAELGGSGMEPPAPSPTTSTPGQ